MSTPSRKVVRLPLMSSGRIKVVCVEDAEDLGVERVEHGRVE
jgi:hypothetical protein